MDKISFLERILGKCKYSASTREALFNCPFCHHHKPKLSINIETDKWQCWPCGKAGNHLGWLIKQTGSNEDVGAYFSKYKSNSVKIKFKLEDLDFRFEFPKEFEPLITCRNSFLGKKVCEYLIEKRGITEEDILRFKIGTTMSGDLRGRIVLPSFDVKGNLNLYTTRSINPDPNYFTPQFPKGYKTQIILNELNIDWKKPVVIVEGYFDMLKSVPNTVPLFGSTLTQDYVLFDKIVRYSTPVILGLDPDAIKKRNKIAENFIRRDVSVYTVDIDPYEDIGKMSKKEFAIRYENATPISTEDILRSRIRSVC